MYGMVMRNRETTPIVNVLDSQDIRDKFVLRYLALCHGKPKKGKVVEWHKEKLGRQDRTWVGFRRYWIWEYEDFRLYVNNVVGVGFEIPLGTSSEQALQAWDRYEKLMMEG